MNFCQLTTAITEAEMSAWQDEGIPGVWHADDTVWAIVII